MATAELLKTGAPVWTLNRPLGVAAAPPIAALAPALISGLPIAPAPVGPEAFPAMAVIAGLGRELETAQGFDAKSAGTSSPRATHLLFRSFFDAAGRRSADEPIERRETERKPPLEPAKPIPGARAKTEPPSPSLPPPAAPVPGGLKKAALIAAGVALIAIGVVLLPLPGPGFALILAGLALLARHFVWARQALAWLRSAVTRVVDWLKRAWKRR